MSTPLFVQAVVIALVVLWSALYAVRRLLPVASRRAQARIAGAFDHPALPRWLRHAAQRLQPTGTSGGSCGDGCSSCGGCAAADARPTIEALPLEFRSRPRP